MALRNRSRGVNFLNELIQRADDRLVTFMESGFGKKRRRDGESAIDSNLFANVPLFLRDLLARLPPHTGPPPDIDTFLEHLKKTVLPPRPVTDERDENTTQSTIAGNTTGAASTSTTTTTTTNVNGLRQLNGTNDDAVILLSGGKRTRNYDDEDEDDEIVGSRNDDGSRDDIFQQRCRRRMDKNNSVV